MDLKIVDRIQKPFIITRNVNIMFVSEEKEEPLVFMFSTAVNFELLF